ncbi:MAG TPA: hypothetical protein PL155_08410 [Candidatus Omnitrophota bacterium]|nr:hypothetical protein [Candidatus Omnitrophota bacterium]HPD85146.1 hypothetical protein [Candidatus Omnitrophota bacterium]HRZ04353.1 hypothetical protein [Candidatus Omnitrophota bacterium]
MVKIFNGPILKLRQKNIKAFTLIEIFLVIGLLAAISIAVYSAFSGGLKVWQRAKGALAQEDIMIFLDKISYDLRNSLMYSQIRFEGKPQSISFGAIVRTPVDLKKNPKGDDYTDEIGKVEYYFDGNKKNMYRRQANYSQAINHRFSKEYLLSKDITSLKFQYYYRSGATYVLKENAKDILPSCVRIDLEFKDRKDRRNIVRLVNIPKGN